MCLMSIQLGRNSLEKSVFWIKKNEKKKPKNNNEFLKCVPDTQA